MDFNVGDPVMHWMYGFGHVVGIEEWEIAERNSLYYAISIRDLNVWVPDDDQLEFRLRAPMSKKKFQGLFAILTGHGEPLSTDRQERKTWLVEKMKDGQAASLCTVLRALATYQQEHQLNDHDQSVMKRSIEALLGEWIHAFAVPISEAERELHRMLADGNTTGEKKKDR